MGKQLLHTCKSGSTRDEAVLYTYKSGSAQEEAVLYAYKSGSTQEEAVLYTCKSELKACKLAQIITNSASISNF